jgi:transposase-like protein
METGHKRGADPAEKDATGVIRELPVACTDERLAVEFLERQRWGDHPACPRCGDLDVYQMRDRKTGERSKRFLWKCNGCGEQYTVRIGTIFEESRIPLRHWCFAFWSACSSKKGISALQVRRQTQISYKSALFMMHRIRHVMAPGAPAPKLTGTVEADETYVGGKMRPRERKEWGRLKRQGLDMRRPSNKTPVMAMVERGGNVRAVVLADVTAKNVRQVLLANVSPDANLRTDEGGHYISIGRRFASHEAVKHSLYEFVRGDASTNVVESFFSRLKRQLCAFSKR